MLIPNKDIYCGVFDSSIVRKNVMKSEARRVECFELEVFTEQSGVSYIDGNKYPVRRGMMLAAKPGQIRHSDFPVKCNFIRVFINERLDEELRSLLLSLPTCSYLDTNDSIDEIFALFSQLGSCFVSSSCEADEEVLVNALFYNILYKFLHQNKGENVSSKNHDINKVVLGACEYINEKYFDDCSLKKIADAVSVSPNYLHTVFSKSVGMSPYDYLIKKRIECAKRLIRAGQKNMLEIALETGFCSQSHFCKIFKEQTGETPTVFRKRIFSGF